MLPESRKQTAPLLANAIRVMSLDAVDDTKKGHPGILKGMADIAVALRHLHLFRLASNPPAGHDRVVLSSSHGSMLLYSLLHLTGHDVSAADLQVFRQIIGNAPDAPGVKIRAGALGQGLSNAVSMAIGDKTLATTFGRPGHHGIGRYTFVLATSDCLTTRISHEACSLAGSLGLDKLILIHDDYGVPPDAKLDDASCDDTPARFADYGWQVISPVDRSDLAAVERAIFLAKAETTRPTLICCRMAADSAPAEAASPDRQDTSQAAGDTHRSRLVFAPPHTPRHMPSGIHGAHNLPSRQAATVVDGSRLPAHSPTGSHASAAGAVSQQNRLVARKGSNAIQVFGPRSVSFELLEALRLRPEMDVWRPCDPVETAIAWKIALEQTATGTGFVLCHEGLPTQLRTQEQIDAVRKGGYVLGREHGQPDAVIIACGSEVPVAIGALRGLAKQGIRARVVSMPSPYTFDRQDDDYRAGVLPADVPRISIDVGGTDYWRRYVGRDGQCVGIDMLPETAPSELRSEHFNLNVTRVEKAVGEALEKYDRIAAWR
ncbi:transketolase C-terminal domain-containing protein [Rhizobium sp. BK251]|uniref:transketolase-like TK C-terminal-containing protein n=1 Tax=Rhizobium sp. BK251 TaxID=2512125 RepID=UPI001044DA5F|nr:transketolase C-terminal domain-containing protein [Rhizobium sp. BK251]TCL70318.1 transketolase-like protein [Rhizobium sp. BK251]